MKSFSLDVLYLGNFFQSLNNRTVDLNNLITVSTKIMSESLVPQLERQMSAKFDSEVKPQIEAKLKEDQDEMKEIIKNEIIRDLSEISKGLMSERQENKWLQ